MLKLIKLIKTEAGTHFLFLLTYMLGYVGLFIRRFIFKRLFQKLGSDFSSEIGIKVTFPKHISLGNNFSIMRF
tara:strand:- start:8744 stop:8962 length:219 start_codon:yes stop_codon:yes gene_type:complete